MKNFNQLSARKQEILKAAHQKAISAGVQFMQVVNQVNGISVQLDDNARSSLKFLLVDCPDMCKMGIEQAYLLAAIPNPDEMKTLTVRQFNQLMNLIKSIELTGRENLLNFYEAVQIFEKAGQTLDRIQNDQQILAKEFNAASAQYNKLCTEYEVVPANIDEQVAQVIDEQIKAAQEEKSENGGEADGNAEPETTAETETDANPGEPEPKTAEEVNETAGEADGETAEEDNETAEEAEPETKTAE